MSFTYGQHVQQTPGWTIEKLQPGQQITLDYAVIFIVAVQKKCTPPSDF